jgi:predicted RND superfamily exporter protein
VALIGGWLALSGQGIELANGLALTVAFGVAVDDTLHVLNRIRLSGGFARIEPARLRAAMREAAPVLVTTSTVLVLGFGGSAFAATQEVADFGAIATSVFVLALFADLLVLPAAVAFLGPRFYLSARKGQR